MSARRAARLDTDSLSATVTVHVALPPGATLAELRAEVSLLDALPRRIEERCRHVVRCYRGAINDHFTDDDGKVLETKVVVELPDGTSDRQARCAWAQVMDVVRSQGFDVHLAR